MRTLAEIIEELATLKGYPYLKLSYSEYMDVLKKAHKIKYGK